MDRAAREEVVDWFALRMKLKLQQPHNEAKPSWREETVSALRIKLAKELEELDRVLWSPLINGGVPAHVFDSIIDECCDVAAFAMMIADRARQLKG